MHIETPLIPSEPLGRRLGARVWLKLECAQPTGSFKLRGIGAMCQQAVDAGADHLLSSSAGNAGLNVAYAGRELCVPVTVVVPESTPEMMRSRIRALDAEVVVHGSCWDESDAVARERALSPGAFHAHPFEHSSIWRGHATLVHEVAAQDIRPDIVVLAVGGGGLLSGIAQGMDDVGWGRIPILACETRGADCLARALAANERVTLHAIESIARSLGALTVGQRAFDVARSRPVASLVVRDRQALDACLRFADDHRILVEPACGAALAAVYENDDALHESANVLVIVCGGVAVDLDMLRVWDREVA